MARGLTGRTALDFGGIVRRDPARVVVSSHDFDGVPPDLDDRVRAMRGVGAGVDQGGGRRLAADRDAAAEANRR